MTEQQIIKTLGEKVMGWEPFFHEGMQLWGWKQELPYYFTSGWNPLKNVEHAWKLVEKFEQYSILKGKFEENQTVSLYNNGWHAGTGKTICEAAVNAAMNYVKKSSV
ncbi:BC1872 family protein [Brevibacillus reuszeri]|uniref:BC1872 family protein n=1 Tax=Brevibacillus reuszeri TaxID=54915 RepID=UPI0028A19C81|nr:hypothetical protein [Brevibacillus reuszeri]